MKHVWWRTHLRKLEALGSLERFGNFEEADELMPFLIQALDLPTGGRVLEVGCGRGTLTVRLAQWGYEVTGVEQSAAMLEVARREAANRDVQVDFRHLDPLQLPERSAFDGVLIADFGTRVDADNAALLRTIAATLKPGGRVVFSTCNPYYWSREPRTEHRVINGTDVIRNLSFDFNAGSVSSRVRLIRPNGERQSLPSALIRAYTIPELRAQVAATGLADLRIFGEDENGVPRPDLPLDSLRTRFFHCVALRPVTGESGEGI